MKGGVFQPASPRFQNLDNEVEVPWQLKVFVDFVDLVIWLLCIEIAIIVDDMSENWDSIERIYKNGVLCVYEYLHE